MGPDAYLVAALPADQATQAPFGDPPGLELAHVGPGLWVWVSSRPPRLRVAPISSSAVLIGEAYRSDAHAGDVADQFDLSSLAASTVEDMCGRLLQGAWGRYVLITHMRQATAAFRDPSGALDCMAWQRGDQRFFAGRLPKELDPCLTSAVSIDWPIVARHLQNRLAVSGTSALRNIDAIAPGALWIGGSNTFREIRQLWRPSEVARRGSIGGQHPADRLRERVRTSVTTLMATRPRLVAELSGGLDSAIVASSLIGAGVRQPAPGRAIRWINYATAELEGDERPYAREVARHLGLELTERSRPDLRYTEATLAAVGSDFRVGLTALDPAYDADLVQQAADHGADALVTGQGGDTVFLQMASIDGLADRLRSTGRVDLSELLSHSRRRRCTVWGALGTTIRRAVWPALPSPPVPSYLAERVAAREPAHPWLADIHGLPAAKALQIESLVASQNVFGPSPRSRVVCCLHPLLSQPVVELTLALPSYELARGGIDRALARSAFEPWLPPVLRSRRSKGSMQAFYGRAVAASLDVLRPWLLDGLLAKEHLIVRDRLEALLDPDVLIMTDLYVDLLHAAAIEAWVRGWSDRIAAIKNRPAAQPVLCSAPGN